MNETMKLFNYYNLDECVDKKLITDKLKSLSDDGKIDYEIDSEILKLEDIDLEENDISDLVQIFDDYDVFPHLDYDDDDDDYDDFSDDDDDDHYNSDDDDDYDDY